MSDKPDKPKKNRGIVKALVFGALLAGAGGGTAYGLVMAGYIGGHAERREADPQLVLKDEKDPYAVPAPKGAGDEPDIVHGEGGSRYRTAYYRFSDDFTSNLRGSDALVQLSLAASTRRDGRVLMWLDQHQLAIRSRILVALADTPEDDVLTPDGKARLQQRLTKAVNDVLTEQEGFGGVDNVYFRTFIVR